jgi:serine protease inhibitor
MPVAVIRADRPFLFAVHDDITRNLLFVAKVDSVAM